MTVLEAVLLGLIQGLTEFLPVSSSGHLAIAAQLFGLKESPVFLDALMHIGTLAAVIIVFRKTVWELIKAFFSLIGKVFTGKAKWKNLERYEKMLVFFIVSCLPLLVVLLYKDMFENLSSKLWVVGIALIINSVILFFSDRVKERKKNVDTMTALDALSIGVVQMIAVTPGISRSGSTITMGVLRGLDRQFAAEYSFILSIPTILAGAAVGILDTVKDGLFVMSDLPAYIAGALTAAVVGVFAIRLLRYLLKSKKFIIFAVYCLVVGITVTVIGLL